MTDNLYAPMQADLGRMDANEAEFYVVGRTKFLCLFVLTLGLYQLYWSYKQWSQYQKATGDAIWPVARGLFSIFFVHKLYARAAQRIRDNGRSYVWNHDQWATAFVVASVGPHLLGGLASNEQGIGVITGLVFGLIFVRIWVIARGQQAINVAANDPEGRMNARFTLLNYLWVVPGSLFLLIFVVDLGLVGFGGLAEG